MSTVPPMILVQPYKSFIDQPVNIRGSGFKKNTKITAEFVLQCSEEKLHFMAYGHYLTSDNGSFDTEEMNSFRGTYMGTVSLGLFWSMKQLQVSNFVVSLKDGRSVLNYCFNVYDGHITDFSLANSLSGVHYFLQKREDHIQGLLPYMVLIKVVMCQKIMLPI